VLIRPSRGRKEKGEKKRGPIIRAGGKGGNRVKRKSPVPCIGGVKGKEGRERRSPWSANQGGGGRQKRRAPVSRAYTSGGRSGEEKRREKQLFRDGKKKKGKGRGKAVVEQSSRTLGGKEGGATIHRVSFDFAETKKKKRRGPDSIFWTPRGEKKKKILRLVAAASPSLLRLPKVEKKKKGKDMSFHARFSKNKKGGGGERERTFNLA